MFSKVRRKDKSNIKRGKPGNPIIDLTGVTVKSATFQARQNRKPKLNRNEIRVAAKAFPESDFIPSSIHDYQKKTETTANNLNLSIDDSLDTSIQPTQNKWSTSELPNSDFVQINHPMSHQNNLNDSLTSASPIEQNQHNNRPKLTTSQLAVVEDFRRSGWGGIALLSTDYITGKESGKSFDPKYRIDPSVVPTGPVSIHVVNQQQNMLSPRAQLKSARVVGGGFLAESPIHTVRLVPPSNVQPVKNQLTDTEVESVQPSRRFSHLAVNVMNDVDDDMDDSFEKEMKEEMEDVVATYTDELDPFDKFPPSKVENQPQILDNSGTGLPKDENVLNESGQRAVSHHVTGLEGNTDIQLLFKKHQENANQLLVEKSKALRSSIDFTSLQMKNENILDGNDTAANETTENLPFKQHQMKPKTSKLRDSMDFTNKNKTGNKNFNIPLLNIDSIEGSNGILEEQEEIEEEEGEGTDQQDNINLNYSLPAFQKHQTKSNSLRSSLDFNNMKSNQLTDFKPLGLILGKLEEDSMGEIKKDATVPSNTTATPRSGSFHHTNRNPNNITVNNVNTTIESAQSNRSINSKSDVSEPVGRSHRSKSLDYSSLTRENNDNTNIMKLSTQTLEAWNQRRKSSGSISLAIPSVTNQITTPSVSEDGGDTVPSSPADKKGSSSLTSALPFQSILQSKLAAIPQFEELEEHTPSEEEESRSSVGESRQTSAFSSPRLTPSNQAGVRFTFDSTTGKRSMKPCLYFPSAPTPPIPGVSSKHRSQNSGVGLTAGSTTEDDDETKGTDEASEIEELLMHSPAHLQSTSMYRLRQANIERNIQAYLQEHNFSGNLEMKQLRQINEESKMEEISKFVVKPKSAYLSSVLVSPKLESPVQRENESFATKSVRKVFERQRNFNVPITVAAAPRASTAPTTGRIASFGLSPRPMTGYRPQTNQLSYDETTGDGLDISPDLTTQMSHQLARYKQLLEHKALGMNERLTKDQEKKLLDNLGRGIHAIDMALGTSRRSPSPPGSGRVSPDVLRTVSPPVFSQRRTFFAPIPSEKVKDEEALEEPDIKPKKLDLNLRWKRFLPSSSSTQHQEYQGESVPINVSNDGTFFGLDQALANYRSKAAEKESQENKMDDSVSCNTMEDMGSTSAWVDQMLDEAMQPQQQEKEKACDEEKHDDESTPRVHFIDEIEESEVIKPRKPNSPRPSSERVRKQPMKPAQQVFEFLPAEEKKAEDPSKTKVNVSPRARPASSSLAEGIRRRDSIRAQLDEATSTVVGSHRDPQGYVSARKISPRRVSTVETAKIAMLVAEQEALKRKEEFNDTGQNRKVRVAVGVSSNRIDKEMTKQNYRELVYLKSADTGGLKKEEYEMIFRDDGAETKQDKGNFYKVDNNNHTTHTSLRNTCHGPIVHKTVTSGLELNVNSLAANLHQRAAHQTPTDQMQQIQQMLRANTAPSSPASAKLTAPKLMPAPPPEPEKIIGKAVRPGSAPAHRRKTVKR